MKKEKYHKEIYLEIQCLVNYASKRYLVRILGHMFPLYDATFALFNDLF